MASRGKSLGVDVYSVREVVPRHAQPSYHDRTVAAAEVAAEGEEENEEVTIDEQIQRAQAIRDDASKPTRERLEAATEVCALLDVKKRREQKAAIAMLMQNCEVGK